MKRYLMAAGMATILGFTGIQTAQAAVCGLACSRIDTTRTGHTLTTVAPTPVVQTPAAQTNVTSKRTGHIKRKPGHVNTTPRTGHVRGSIHLS